MDEDRTFRSGSGRISLDFLRTLRWRGTEEAVEELDTPAALHAWTAQFGPLAGDEFGEPAPQAVRTAQAMREAAYSLLKAARTSGAADCPPAARAVLNEIAATPTPAPALAADGTLGHHAADPVAAVLSLVARDALDLATSPQLARVRDCAGPNCGAWFLDTSRPGTRRWCSMDRCGNQAKKSTWRSKHAAAQ